MTVPVDQLLLQLATVLALYNRRSMDLPDGLFGRNAQFRLNGTSFEETAAVALHLAPSGSIDAVDAEITPEVRTRLRDARLRP